MTELQGGQVTLADLFRELTGMRADLARALTRLEVIDARNGDADRLHNDHEQRIRALEAFRWKLAGVAVILGILVGIVSAWATSRGH